MVKQLFSPIFLAKVIAVFYIASFPSAMADNSCSSLFFSRSTNVAPAKPSPHYSTRIRQLNSAILRAQKQKSARSELQESADLFKSIIENISKEIEAPKLVELANKDPYIKAKLEQIHFNLIAVSIDTVGGRYAYTPTLLFLIKVRSFYELLSLEKTNPTLIGDKGKLAAELTSLANSEKQRTKLITSDPLNFYLKISKKISQEGPNAPFPEVANTIRSTEINISSEGIMKEVAGNNFLSGYRESVLKDIASVRNKNFPYRETLEVLQTATEFLDVYQRGKPGNKTAKLYHSRRWQYHSHLMKAAAPGYILFPTTSSLGIKDFIRTRGIPLGLIGVIGKSEYADGFFQTPYEFWLHDINHSRRMWQQFNARAKELGISVNEYARLSDNYITNEIMPMLNIKKSDTPMLKNLKRIAAVILFEISHEEALPLDKETIRRALLRGPYQMADFVYEKISTDSSSVNYYQRPSATITSVVFRKLEGEFFDKEHHRIEGLGSPDARTQEMVYLASELINQHLGLNIPQKTLRENVLDDSGIPPDLRAKIIKRLSKYPDSTRPLNERAQRKAEQRN